MTSLYLQSFRLTAKVQHAKDEQEGEESSAKKQEVHELDDQIKDVRSATLEEILQQNGSRVETHFGKGQHRGWLKEKELFPH